MTKASKIIIFQLGLLTIALIYSLVDSVHTYSVEMSQYRADLKKVGNAWDSCWMVEWGEKDKPEEAEVKDNSHSHTHDEANRMFITCGM